MIRVYRRDCPEPDQHDVAGPMPDDAVWIDLFDPTPEEEAAVERALKLQVPTRKEMGEIEDSSRIYRENDALYLTADLLHSSEDDLPGVEPVTFILTHGPMITIRYIEPKAFTMMADKLKREPHLCAGGPDVYLHLMETVVDRASDVLSRESDHVEAVAMHIFAGRRTAGFEKLIGKLGKARIAIGRIDRSLAGLERLFAFALTEPKVNEKASVKADMESLRRDARSLLAHAQSVAASIDFQLSAALGLINIEQSSIIKIFSVASVALLPPTLIASIYGMNFVHMPELAQPWGYPAALLAMLVSVLVPLAWFRYRRWL